MTKVSSSLINSLGASQIDTTVSLVSANYTLAVADENTIIQINKSAAVTINVPTDAVALMPVGTQIVFVQTGAGQLTVAAVTPGTTSVNGANGLKTNARYSIISLFKVAANSWVVGGDTTL